MIRKSTFKLDYANTGKLNDLDRILEESVRVVNLFIELLWETGASPKFVTAKVDTWLSARMQQCLGKQASEIVRSQRKRKFKTKPLFKRASINLDSRFLSYAQGGNSFDFWITLASVGAKLKLKLPSRKHRHFNGFQETDWKLRGGGRLRKTVQGYFLDVYFEREPEPKPPGQACVGLDAGYKKLAVLSDGQVVGRDIEQKCEKISRKKQGSKAFRRALRERDNYIRQQINLIDLSRMAVLVVEDLKDVRKDARKKKRLSKKFMNKFQRWTYSQLLGWLEDRCEVVGVQLHRVNPAYTSQTCSRCGAVDKASRKGEKFCCTSCGHTADADVNASQNISMKFLETGVYSPRPQTE